MHCNDAKPTLSFWCVANQCVCACVHKIGVCRFTDDSSEKDKARAICMYICIAMSTTEKNDGFRDFCWCLPVNERGKKQHFMLFMSYFTIYVRNLIYMFIYLFIFRLLPFFSLRMQWNCVFSHSLTHIRAEVKWTVSAGKCLNADGAIRFRNRPTSKTSRRLNHTHRAESKADYFVVLFIIFTAIERSGMVFHLHCDFMASIRSLNWKAVAIFTVCIHSVGLQNLDKKTNKQKKRMPFKCWFQCVNLIRRYLVMPSFSSSFSNYLMQRRNRWAY